MTCSRVFKGSCDCNPENPILQSSASFVLLGIGRSECISHGPTSAKPSSEILTKAGEPKAFHLSSVPFCVKEVVLFTLPGAFPLGNGSWPNADDGNVGKLWRNRSWARSPCNKFGIGRDSGQNNQSDSPCCGKGGGMLSSASTAGARTCGGTGATVHGRAHALQHLSDGNMSRPVRIDLRCSRVSSDVRNSCCPCANGQ